MLVGGMLANVSPTQAATYTESVDLGAAGSYSVIAGAAFTVGAGNLINGDTIFGVAGATKGPGLAASEASANAADRTATFTSDSTNFPNNRTLTAGVYKYTSYIAATGALTLDGENDPNAVFIFQISGYLSTEAGFQVVLSNGTKASNVYWQIDGYFSPGASTKFKGTVIAGTYITTGAGMTLNGRLFALGGAVTTGATNTITSTTTTSLITQTMTWNPTLTVVTTASPLLFDGATGNGQGAVSYAVTDAGTTGCTVNSTTPTLTYTGAGSCTVTATIAATSRYAAVTKSKTFTINIPISSTTVPGTQGLPGNTGNTGVSGNLGGPAGPNDSLRFADGDIQVFLSGLGSNSQVLPLGDDGMLKLTFGGQLVIRQASGFAPNSMVSLNLMSPKKLLRKFRTDENGAFSGSVFLPPNTHVGVRMMGISGFKSSGQPRTLWIRARFNSAQGTNIKNCHIHITKTLVRPC